MIFSLEWKAEVVLDGEQKVMMRWYVQDGVNHESEQNEVDGMKVADSTYKMMHT